MEKLKLPPVIIIDNCTAASALRRMTNPTKRDKKLDEGTSSHFGLRLHRKVLRLQQLRVVDRRCADLVLSIHQRQDDWGFRDSGGRVVIKGHEECRVVRRIQHVNARSIEYGDGAVNFPPKGDSHVRRRIFLFARDAVRFCHDHGEETAEVEIEVETRQIRREREGVALQSDGTAFDVVLPLFGVCERHIHGAAVGKEELAHRYGAGAEVVVGRPDQGPDVIVEGLHEDDLVVV
mmetsp:Transcript_24494/g.43932  ORF Transcript_24494/g.43932 Transcript_24494/m.43932 type:complete len:234 (+) Transcript_24494:231-932(+)